MTSIIKVPAFGYKNVLPHYLDHVMPVFAWSLFVKHVTFALFGSDVTTVTICNILVM